MQKVRKIESWNAQDRKVTYLSMDGKKEIGDVYQTGVVNSQTGDPMFIPVLVRFKAMNATNPEEVHYYSDCMLDAWAMANNWNGDIGKNSNRILNWHREIVS